MTTKFLVLFGLFFLNASLCLAAPTDGQKTFAIDGAIFNSETGEYLPANAGKIYHVDFLDDTTLRFSLDSKQAYGITFKSHDDATLFQSGIQSMPGRYQVLIPSSNAYSAMKDSHADSTGGGLNFYDDTLEKGVAPFWNAQVKDVASGRLMTIDQFLKIAGKYEVKRAKDATTQARYAEEAKGQYEHNLTGANDWLADHVFNLATMSGPASPNDARASSAQSKGNVNIPAASIASTHLEAIAGGL